MQLGSGGREEKEGLQSGKRKMREKERKERGIGGREKGVYVRACVQGVGGFEEV